MSILDISNTAIIQIIWSSPCDLELSRFYCTLKLKLLVSTKRHSADSVDQDQTTRNVQSDLRSTLSDEEISHSPSPPKKNEFEIDLKTFELFTIDMKISFCLLTGYG